MPWWKRVSCFMHFHKTSWQITHHMNAGVIKLIHHFNMHHLAIPPLPSWSERRSPEMCVSHTSFSFQAFRQSCMELVLHANQQLDHSTGSKNFYCAWTLGIPTVLNGFFIFCVLPSLSIKAGLSPLPQSSSISAVQSHAQGMQEGHGSIWVGNTPWRMQLLYR